MRYQGEKDEIEAIESEIRSNSLSFTKSKLRPFDDLFGIPSPVEVKVFEILPKKEAYLFPIRFFYDNRDGCATLDIKDKDIQWLMKLSPNIKTMIERLIPQRLENGSYHHNGG